MRCRCRSNQGAGGHDDVGAMPELETDDSTDNTTDSDRGDEGNDMPELGTDEEGNDDVVAA